MFIAIQKEENALQLFVFLKNILQGACADVFTRPPLANIVAIPCKRTQHCCTTLRQSQNNRNVRTCWAKSLTGFKLYATSANKCQHCCGSMQTEATSHNIVGPIMLGIVGQMGPFARAFRVRVRLEPIQSQSLFEDTRSSISERNLLRCLLRMFTFRELSPSFLRSMSLKRSTTPPPLPLPSPQPPIFARKFRNHRTLLHKDTETYPFLFFLFRVTNCHFTSGNK